MAWVSLVQWRSGGKKSLMGHSHGYFISFFWLSKVLLEKIIFKWVPLLIKCNRFWNKGGQVQRKCASIFLHKLFQFLLHSNSVATGPKIKIWVCSEEKTGRGRLNTHLLYVNIVMKLYVYTENYIDVGENMFKALWFQGSIIGTMAVILDAGLLQGTIISNQSKPKTEIFWTHEIQFNDKFQILFNFHVFKSQRKAQTETGGA